MDATEIVDRLIDPREKDIGLLEIQTLAVEFANHINRRAPDGRQKSLAMTAIEEALLWTKKACR